MGKNNKDSHFSSLIDPEWLDSTTAERKISQRRIPDSLTSLSPPTPAALGDGGNISHSSSASPLRRFHNPRRESWWPNVVNKPPNAQEKKPVRSPISRKISLPTPTRSWTEEIIEDSRLPGYNNGAQTIETPETKIEPESGILLLNNKPNGEQKWLFAFLLALLFVILASSPGYFLSQKVYRDFKGVSFPTPPLWAVLIQGFFFLLLVRLILW
jgi:hypothetical protein